MSNIPRIMIIISFKDFCIRCEEIYQYFWENFAPFFDIAIYRDYLLYEVEFSNKNDKQEQIAGKCWEFLMGDLTNEELFYFFASIKRNI